MKSIIDILNELRRWLLLAGEPMSFVRMAYDLVMSRIQRSGKRERPMQTHTVRLRGGIVISYRMNRGDLWSFREIWLDQCYRFPGTIKPDTIIDLGGNIGMTSLWMAKQYQPKTLIIIEPEPGNAAIAKLNLEQNNIACSLIEAAVGNHDGSALFVCATNSNQGHADFASPGSTRLVSMATVLAQVPNDRNKILLKVDIEGGEENLFADNLEWLNRIDAIIAEFHPSVTDPAPIIQKIEAAGFRYIQNKSVFHNNMDAFIRM